MHNQTQCFINFFQMWSNMRLFSLFIIFYLFFVLCKTLIRDNEPLSVVYTSGSFSIFYVALLTELFYFVVFLSKVCRAYVFVLFQKSSEIKLWVWIEKKKGVGPDKLLTASKALSTLLFIIIFLLMTFIFYCISLKFINGMNEKRQHRKELLLLSCRVL